MAGLPVVGHRAIGLEHRIGREKSRRLDVDDEAAFGLMGGDVTRQHDADLVGEDLVAFIVDHAAAVAVAVEAEADIGARLEHLVADRVQHLHVFGIGIVARKTVVELGVERDDLAADALQHLRRECSGCSVAASRHHAQFPADARVPCEIIQVAFPKAVDEAVAAAVRQIEVAGKHDLLEGRHLVRAECERALAAHLDARPAILVVRGGDHGDGRDVERELGEIGHRRQREADVVDPRAGRHQPGSERQLDRHRVASEIVSGDDVRADAAPPDQRRQAHSQRLDTHQVQFRRLFGARMAEPPACVILAKTRRPDDGAGLEFEAVRAGFADRC